MSSSKSKHPASYYLRLIDVLNAKLDRQDEHIQRLLLEKEELLAELNAVYGEIVEVKNRGQ